MAADDLDGLVRRVDPDRWLATRFIADEAKRADVIALYAFDYELARARQVTSNAADGGDPSRLVAGSSRRDLRSAAGARSPHGESPGARRRQTRPATPAAGGDDRRPARRARRRASGPGPGSRGCRCGRSRRAGVGGGSRRRLEGIGGALGAGRRSHAGEEGGADVPAQGRAVGGKIPVTIGLARRSSSWPWPTTNWPAATSLHLALGFACSPPLYWETLGAA